jgi:adenosylcobinamide amidohydrolase
VRIDGVATRVGPDAVVVTAEHELDVLSSAVVAGGFTRARTILNVHVSKSFACADATATVAAAAHRLGVPVPWVGLLTAAWTERAELAVAEADGVRALVVATIGLSHASAAGITARAAPVPATINTIVVLDANPAPAAMVNAVSTVTEVKTDVLRAAGVRCADGRAATGTPTDAIVVAATGRGPLHRFGGPLSDVGWAAATATREALEAGVRRWLIDNRDSAGPETRDGASR